MRTIRTFGLFALVVLFVLTVAARPAGGQTLYNPTALGTLGGNDSEAYALNNHTQIAGRSHDPDGLTHAFQWQDGELLDLNVELRWHRRLMHLDYAVAYGLSDTDHVVGAKQCGGACPDDAVGDDSPGGKWLHAFVYRPAAATDDTTPYPGDPLTDLGTLGTDADLESAATGISPNGLYVVGWSDTAPNSSVHAFLISPVNGQWASGCPTCEEPNNPLLLDLSTLTAADRSSSATAINNRGQVVGWSYSDTNGYAAFLLTPRVDVDGNPVEWVVDDGNGANALMISLGTLPGADGQTLGTNSWARDINEAGQVVGEADTGDYATHAFLWQNGTMIDLGTLGGKNSSASALNEASQVVGWALNAQGEKRAFVITPADSDADDLPDQWYADENGDGANDLMADLNMLLPSGFQILLTEARDINELGEIVGWGSVGTGEEATRMAFLLTPTDVTDTGGEGGDGDGGTATTSDVDLVPIEPGGDNDQPDETPDTAGEDSVPVFGLAHWLCGVGVISVVPILLGSLCGMKLALRRGRRSI